MVRKLLTAIDQQVARATTTLATVTSGRQALLMAWTRAEQTTVTVQKAVTLPLLNVQRLMTYMRLIALTKLLPMLPPKEFRRGIDALLIPTPEEEKAIRRRTLPYRQMEELRTERIQRLRPERTRQQAREIPFSPTSINLIDQTAFARLEAWLWTNFPLQVMQVLGELIEQVIRKSWYLDRIVGLEPLEKLMLQMYVYAFMEFPQQLNMLGLRVTPLTMFVLRHRVGSIYMTYATLKQDVMSKALLLSALLRKPELKGILAGKTRQEWIPRKENIATTTDVTEETIVSTGRDLKGKEWFFTALRYAYGMPFWLRRRLARQFGMPENHKYARYFGIGCIPTRYARYSWKYRRYTEESFTYFRRDEYLKRLKLYDKMHNVGVSYKRRYGGWRFWTRR